MRLHLIASAIILLAAAPAFASGGIACDAESGPVQFSVSAAMGRDFGAGIFALNGSLTAALPGVAKDLQRLSYGLETPHQVWLDRDVLYFELMVTRPGNGPYGSSDLVIKTEAVDEGSFEGRYSFSVSDGAVEVDGVPQQVDVTGTVSCVAD